MANARGGFTRNEVRLRVDGSDNIKISGERQVDEEKCIYFDQTFHAPQDSDMDKVRGKFEGEILYVTVPRREAEVNSQSKSLKRESDCIRDVKENECKNNGRGGDGQRLEEPCTFKNAFSTLTGGCRGIVFIALIAIAVGLLLSSRKSTSTNLQ